MRPETSDRTPLRVKLQRPANQVPCNDSSSQVRRFLGKMLATSRSDNSSGGWLQRSAGVGVALTLVIVAAALAAFISVRVQASNALRSKIAKVLIAARAARGGDLTGTIEAIKANDLGFTISGRLKSLRVHDGEHVRAGQVLAELDAEGLQAELAVAHSELKLALSKSPVRKNYTTAGPQSGAPDAMQNLAEHWSNVIKLLEIKLQHARLVAPYDCVVSNTYISEGGLVKAESPVVKILAAKGGMLRVVLPEGSLQHFQSQESHTVLIGDREVIGKVQAVLPSINGKRTTRSVLILLNDIGPQDIGANARIQIEPTS